MTRSPWLLRPGFEAPAQQALRTAQVLERPDYPPLVTKQTLRKTRQTPRRPPFPGFVA